jgi:hypothetical protein
MADHLDPTTQAAPVEDPEVSEILDDWRCRLRSSTDARPRTGERGQRERALVRALLALATEQGGSQPSSHEEQLQSLAWAGAMYGANMPRERIDPQALCEELAELRHAVWHQLRAQPLAPQQRTERILRFDNALSVALRSALMGGYRATPYHGSQWPESFSEIFADCIGETAPGSHHNPSSDQPPPAAESTGSGSTVRGIGSSDISGEK